MLGTYPVNLPLNSQLIQKVINLAYKHTLHGGVTVTMTQVRSTYRGNPYLDPNPQQLPKVQKEKYFSFQLVSKDYARPINYRLKSKIEPKTHIQLFSCRVSRAVCFKFVRKLTSVEFTRSLKRLITRRRSPKSLYSDNAKTFNASAKWLKKICLG